MIIWVNGAFGVGKTQTSNELHRRIQNSFFFDAENAGYFIRDNLPEEIAKNDFQDFEMWRSFNYDMLKYIDKNYDGIVIVPMTIVNARYHKEIIGRLRNEGVEVHDFVLLASKEVILKRLEKRSEGRDSWAAQQIDRCIDGFKSDIYQYKIDTNNMTISEVAEEICRILCIEI